MQTAGRTNRRSRNETCWCRKWVLIRQGYCEKMLCSCFTDCLPWFVILYYYLLHCRVSILCFRRNACSGSDPFVWKPRWCSWREDSRALCWKQDGSFCRRYWRDHIVWTPRPSVVVRRLFCTRLPLTCGLPQPYQACNLKFQSFWLSSKRFRFKRNLRRKVRFERSAFV